MQRKLGSVEHAFTLNGRAGPLVAVTVLHIRPALDPAKLHQAVPLLQQQRPFLQATLLTKGGRYYLEKCAIVTRKLDAATTARLTQQSRRKRITLNSLASAAMLSAVHHHLYIFIDETALAAVGTVTELHELVLRLTAENDHKSTTTKHVDPT